MATQLLQGSIDRFLASMSANGASPHTVKAYRTDLEGFQSWLETQPPVAMPQDSEMMMASYLTATRQDVAPSTTKRRLATFRSFGKFLGNRNFLADYRSPKVPAGVPHPIRDGVDGVLVMIEKARLPHHKALFALNGLLGLRVSECLSVKASDFYCDNSGGWWVRVRGKGDKTRHVPVSPGVYSYLAEAVALAAYGGGDDRVVALTDRAARRAVSRWGKRAGQGQTASHDLRMTAGTAFYANTKDLRATQELLGHASSDTTQTYTAVSEQARREAASIV